MPTHAEMPGFIAPMLAKLTSLPADDSQWAFEIKWDGMRAIANVDAGELVLKSRNGNEVTLAYPELQGLPDAIGGHSAILDGEIVAFDEHGQVSFQALQTRMHVREAGEAERLAEAGPVTYMVFDLLWLDGRDMTALPYVERRAALDELAIDGAHWQVPEFHSGDGARLLAVSREHHLEGVVAKRLDSRYVPGRRVGWGKIKNSERQEVVIGGWTTGQGARSNRIGALHLGVYDDDGDLHYIGRVGTGFGSAELDLLSTLMKPLARETSPFHGRQPARGAHFVEPKLVCEVEFSEWTQAGTLRQASYKGLRDDKPAIDVVRERPAAASSIPEAPAEQASSPPPPSPERAAPPDIAALVENGRRARDGVAIEIAGRVLKLSNFDKVLYPATGFTKGDLIRFYAAISPVLLPHLRDRPLTLKRYPNGVDSSFFYEKRSPKHRPDWVQTVTVEASRGKPEVPFTLCQELPTLVWLANLADIELHPLLAHAEDVARPTAIVFDLDPGAPADMTQCCEVALELRDIFAQLSLRAFAKTSGSKGLQLYVPLNDPGASYDQTKPFAHAIANLLAERKPDLIVSDMSKAKRGGKVLIDWSQNDEHKTTVSVYSMRATEQPRVSTPVQWDEVARCAELQQPGLLAFTPEQLRTRILDEGDLFSEMLTLRQQCPDLEG
jgi:bifunctional non-homologous end joining protein LigD